MSTPEGGERTCRSSQGCRYVGSAFINSSRAIRKRLWQRVQEHAGPAPKG
jgi:hypothetical protein